MDEYSLKFFDKFKFRNHDPGPKIPEFRSAINEFKENRLFRDKNGLYNDLNELKNNEAVCIEINKRKDRIKKKSSGKHSKKQSKRFVNQIINLHK